MTETLVTLRRDILSARERRQDQVESFTAAIPCLVMLSLNLPGEQKSGERAERLFDWALRRVAGAFPVTHLYCARDALGPYAFYATPLTPHHAKTEAVALESREAPARLLDLDVYDATGAAVGRQALGLPPRPCLLCDHPAVECIRLNRHDSSILQEKVHAIIAAL